jgi:DNA-binding Lrp family transcriptional regulator
MDDKSIQILRIASGDLPLTAAPYDDWARSAGVDPEEFIAELRSSVREGFIRRFGAVLAHTRTGMKVNAMVAWEVAEDSADRVGRIMSGSNAVSHCYLRNPPPGFRYRLFTMIHAADERTLKAVIETLQGETGLDSYVVYPSIREFKKTSPDYLGGA